VWCCFVLFLLKAPLLWIAALLMHGPCIFTCFTLLMGPPIGLWTLAIDSWLSLLLDWVIVIVL
jgi:hypothetical protein